MTKKNNIKTAVNNNEKFVPWVLIFLPLLLYANTIFHGFVLDDRAVTFQNKFVQQGIKGIWNILTTFYWKGYWDLNAGLYRPLSLIMFAIEWQLSPNNPVIHHVIQILMYSLTGLLLFDFLKRISKTSNYILPFVITLLFLSHPVHTEVVANIKSRDEILCLLFFLITTKIILSDKNLSFWRVVLASFTFLLCLLSKEGGILFLPILFLLFRWLKDASFKTSLAYLWLLPVVSIIWLGWHQYVINSSGDQSGIYTYQDNSIVACEGLLMHIGTGFSIVGRYMLKCIWPYQLSYDYSFNEIPCVSFFSMQALLPFIVVASILFFGFRFRNKFPEAGFGILFFFITIALTSNVFFLIGATMADRFLFTPLLGFLIFFVWLVFHEVEHLKPNIFFKKPILLFVPLLLFYGFKTIKRNADWKSDKILFAADVNSAKNSARVYYNYGSLLLNENNANENKKQNNLTECIRLFSEAEQIDSIYPYIFTNLGVAHYRKKNYPEAVRKLSKSLKLNPLDKGVLHNLADAFFMNNQYDSSIYYHQLCIDKNYIQQETYNMLGTAYFNKQQYGSARKAFQAGLKRDSSNASLVKNFGNILGVSNQPDSSIIFFKKAYAINPTDKAILNFISNAYKAKGDQVNADIYLKKYNENR